MTHNDEKEPITVTLDYKPGRERRVRPFYCVKCGKCVCEVTGEAKAIIPGYPSEAEMSDFDGRFVAKCGGVIYLGKDNRVKCTAKYIFN